MSPKRLGEETRIRKRRAMPAPAGDILCTGDVPKLCSAVPQHNDEAAIEVAHQERYNRASYMSRLPLDMFRGMMSERYLRTKSNDIAFADIMLLNEELDYVSFLGARDGSAYFICTARLPDEDSGTLPRPHIIVVTRDCKVTVMPMKLPETFHFWNGKLGDLNATDFGFYCRCFDLNGRVFLSVFSSDCTLLVTRPWDGVRHIVDATYVAATKDYEECIAIYSICVKAVQTDLYRCGSLEDISTGTPCKSTLCSEYVEANASISEKNQTVWSTLAERHSPQPHGSYKAAIAISPDGSCAAVAPVIVVDPDSRCRVLRIKMIDAKRCAVVATIDVPDVPRACLSIGMVDNHGVIGISYKGAPYGQMIKAFVVK